MHLFYAATSAWYLGVENSDWSLQEPWEFRDSKACFQLPSQPRTRRSECVCISVKYLGDLLRAEACEVLGQVIYSWHTSL